MKASRFNRWFGRGWLGGVYLFLYVPIIALVVFSFNDSPIPNVWRGFTLKWYAALAQDEEMLSGLWLSLKIAFMTACGSVVLGTLAAFALVKYKRFTGRTLFSGMVNAPLVMPEVVVGLSLLLMLVMLPFWTSFLLRVYAWKGLLSENGWAHNVLVGSGLDQVLASLGLISAPGQLMNTPFSLVLGMTYTYLPFMILPLYANLSKMDLRLLEAAADLGATPFTAFWKITVPLSKAGIIAGSMLVFIPCVGEYVIPELLGGPQTLMIGRVLWDEFFSNNDWPMAASVAVVMVLLIIVPLAIFNKYQAEATEARK